MLFRGTACSLRSRCPPEPPLTRAGNPHSQPAREKPSLTIIESGGPDRDRTDDLLDANQALSQLSYGPKIALRCLVGRSIPVYRHALAWLPLAFRLAETGPPGCKPGAPI